ncbi:SGNH/GDSL hydrolase family protein [Seonamhaeicola sp.]|uniref:SGNH/GDSL hydrolase family protein n=1 Tax=Seonamhaeicola sp. TaxID=1912245 RepID=UPI0026293801|nr:SGNH/GDSL hydrolase family protein [Seonamhaeicola sp.]
MTKIKVLRIVIVFCLGTFLCSCGAAYKTLTISMGNPQIKVQGRTEFSEDGGLRLYWSGTSIEMRFKGTGLSVDMIDDQGDNYYNVFVDDSLYLVLRPDKTRKTYNLARGLQDEQHIIKIFKRTEWTRGTSEVYGFTVAGENPEILKLKPKKKKIEFYGDSITAGYAVEDLSGKDSPDSTYTNNYKSYAAITARYFDAEYHAICRSGIGIMLGWDDMVMGELYDRLNPNDSLSKWDFNSYKPGIVVINLFQNDSWLVNLPERTGFKKKFGNGTPDDGHIVKSYKDFIKRLREVYPNTKIVCVLGNMDATSKDSVWGEYIKRAVEELNDNELYYLIVPYKDTPGHPNEKEQQVLADSLISFIQNKISWQ